MAEQLHIGSPPSPPRRRPRSWYRRPMLVVPLVLVAAAAVVLLTVFRPTPATRSGTGGVAAAPPVITVNGTVLDSMTGHPVAAAVAVAGHSTRTDVQGAFRLPGVRPNAVLTIRSRNYASTNLAAAAGPVRIRLAPIPVRVKVTSALTGGPLPATIRTPDRGRVIAAAGKATVYRVGPGDRVTITAAGYRPATVSVAADRTVHAALQLLSWRAAAPQILTWMKTKNYTALANWVFSPASGYQYYLGQPTTSSGVVSVEAPRRAASPARHHPHRGQRPARRRADGRHRLVPQPAGHHRHRRRPGRHRQDHRRHHRSAPADRLTPVPPCRCGSRTNCARGEYRGDQQGDAKQQRRRACCVGAVRAWRDRGPVRDQLRARASSANAAASRSGGATSVASS